MTRPLVAVLVLAAAALVCSGSGRPAAASPAQALRVCVDRWNQGNMRGWGPTLARVTARPRCTVALAVRGRRDHTYVCRMNRYGGYDCPPNAEGSPPLGTPNASVDARGAIALDVSLAGTHAPPPLAAERYPRVDGFVLPWTTSGKLRRGLTFAGTWHGRCGTASEQTWSKSALRCFTPAGLVFDPCFGSGSRVACPYGAGATTFARFVVAR